MKIHNFDIFYKMCYIYYLSSALACRVESINTVEDQTRVGTLIMFRYYYHLQKQTKKSGTYLAISFVSQHYSLSTMHGVYQNLLYRCFCVIPP